MYSFATPTPPFGVSTPYQAADGANMSSQPTTAQAYGGYGAVQTIAGESDVERRLRLRREERARRLKATSTNSIEKAHQNFSSAGEPGNANDSFPLGFPASSLRETAPSTIEHNYMKPLVEQYAGLQSQIAKLPKDDLNDAAAPLNDLRESQGAGFPHRDVSNLLVPMATGTAPLPGYSGIASSNTLSRSPEEDKGGAHNDFALSNPTNATEREAFGAHPLRHVPNNASAVHVPVAISNEHISKRRPSDLKSLDVEVPPPHDEPPTDRASALLFPNTPSKSTWRQIQLEKQQAFARELAEQIRERDAVRHQQRAAQPRHTVVSERRTQPDPEPMLSVEPLLPGWRQTVGTSRQVTHNLEASPLRALGTTPEHNLETEARSNMNGREINSAPQNPLYNLDSHREPLTQSLSSIGFLSDPENRAYAAKLLQQMEAEKEREAPVELESRAQRLPNSGFASLSPSRQSGSGFLGEQNKRSYARELLQQMEAAKERKAQERRNELEQERRAQNYLDLEHEKGSAKPSTAFSVPEKRAGIYNFEPEKKQTDSIREPSTPRPIADTVARGRAPQSLSPMLVEELAKERKQRTYADELRAQIESNSKRKQMERQRDAEEAKHCVDVFAPYKPPKSTMDQTVLVGVPPSTAFPASRHITDTSRTALSMQSQMFNGRSSYSQSANHVPPHPQSAYHRSGSGGDDSASQASHRSLSAKASVSYQRHQPPLPAVDMERERKKRAYAEELKAQMESAKKKKEEERLREVEEERKLLDILQQRPPGKRGGGGGDPIYNAAGMRMTAFEDLRENSREMKKKIMGQHVAVENDVGRQQIPNGQQRIAEWQQHLPIGQHEIGQRHQHLTSGQQHIPKPERSVKFNLDSEQPSIAQPVASSNAHVSPYEQLLLRTNPTAQQLLSAQLRTLSRDASYNSANGTTSDALKLGGFQTQMMPSTTTTNRQSSSFNEHVPSSSLPRVAPTMQPRRSEMPNVAPYASTRVSASFETPFPQGFSTSSPDVAPDRVAQDQTFARQHLLQQQATANSAALWQNSPGAASSPSRLRPYSYGHPSDASPVMKAAFGGGGGEASRARNGIQMQQTQQLYAAEHANPSSAGLSSSGGNPSSGSNASAGDSAPSVADDAKRIDNDERERKARDLQEHNAELAKQVEQARRRKEQARLKAADEERRENERLERERREIREKYERELRVEKGEERAESAPNKPPNTDTDTDVKNKESAATGGVTLPPINKSLSPRAPREQSLSTPKVPNSLPNLHGRTNTPVGSCVGKPQQRSPPLPAQRGNTITQNSPPLPAQRSNEHVQSPPIPTLQSPPIPTLPERTHDARQDYRLQTARTDSPLFPVADHRSVQRTPTLDTERSLTGENEFQPFEDEPDDKKLHRSSWRSANGSLDESSNSRFVYEWDSDADDLAMLLPTRTQFIPMDTDEDEVLGETHELCGDKKILPAAPNSRRPPSTSTTPNSRRQPSISATPRLLRLSRSDLKSSCRKLFQSEDFDDAAAERVPRSSSKGFATPPLRATTSLCANAASKDALRSSENTLDGKSPRVLQSDGFPVPDAPSSVVKSHHTRRKMLNSPSEQTFASFYAHSESRQVSQTPRKLQEFLSMYPATPASGTSQESGADIGITSFCESRMQFLSQTRSRLSMQRTQSPHVSLEALGARSRSPSRSNQLPFNSSFVAYERASSNATPQPATTDEERASSNATPQPATTDEEHEIHHDQAPPKAPELSHTLPNFPAKKENQATSPSVARMGPPESARKVPLSVDKRRTISLVPNSNLTPSSLSSLRNLYSRLDETTRNLNSTFDSIGKDEARDSVDPQQNSAKLFTRPATSPVKRRSALVPRLNFSKRTPFKNSKRTHSLILTPALSAPVRAKLAPCAKENSPKNCISGYSPSQVATSSYSSLKGAFTPSKARSEVNNRYGSANFADSSASFDLPMKEAKRPTTPPPATPEESNRLELSGRKKCVSKSVSSSVKTRSSRSPISALRRSISSFISPRRYQKLSSPSLTKLVAGNSAGMPLIVANGEIIDGRNSVSGRDAAQDAQSTSDESYGSDEFVPLPSENT